MAAQGWIHNDGNKYYTLILDSCFYDNVSFEQLNLDTPFRFGGNLWAFHGEDAVEPYLFYIKKIEIKFTGSKKEITITESQPIGNPDNADLGYFFDNDKIYKNKAFRKLKLKEKKDKLKAKK